MGSPDPRNLPLSISTEWQKSQPALFCSAYELWYIPDTGWRLPLIGKDMIGFRRRPLSMRYAATEIRN